MLRFGGIWRKPRRRNEAPRRVLVEPEEGARLIRAFLRVDDPAVRAAIISFTEALQKPPSDSN